MPRCGCASDHCACFIVAGVNVQVTGAGSQADPYVVSADTPQDTTGNPPGVTDSHFVGEIIEYGGATPPSSDYLPCDGRELSRTVYAVLFGRIGSVHGAGNGTTTFNLPNTQDRVTVGAGSGHARGATGGQEGATLVAANLPPHAHAIDHTHAATSLAGLHEHNLRRSTTTGGTANNIPYGSVGTDVTSVAAIGTAGEHSHTVPAFTGSSGNGTGTSTPISTMPPYVAIAKYIRVQ